MNTVVETINAAGGAFVDFALPMLVQSSVLFVILLVIDAVLRRRVRAVFRYWIWMLVLVKLILPPSLWSPVSVGRWLGDPLKAPTAALLELDEPQPAGPLAEPRSIAVSVLSQDVPASVASPALSMEDPHPETVYRQAGMQPDSVWADMDSESPPGMAAVPLAGPSLSWQGLVLLSWAAVAVSLLLLLLQRSFFVRGLVAQADEASAAMQDSLNKCRARIGLRREVALKLSAITGSPAACGLIHPVILIPQNLAPRLEANDLQAVLLHELAHIKRGDLWINLAQTLLQIVYFYNPLLWLANAIIRRTREQAVDEAVLVAMGDTAQQYPETLVNIAKLAFRKRPALSLRLVGVVESRSALSGRIRHMLTRPLPKTAKLGGGGLAVVAIVAAVLLPMAAAQNRGNLRSASREPSTGESLSALEAGLAVQDTSLDSDGDGLSDFQEIHKYLTDPAKKDSDGDGTPDGDWSERREYTYSVRTVLRYLPPFDEGALTDDFQDARVVKRTGDYIEIEVIHYPFATAHESIAENPNWRRDYVSDARLAEYLAPGVTTNWDEQMKRDLSAALKADGIDIEKLTDKQVVERVSSWLMKRSRSLENVFTTYYVDYPQGTPRVYPGLEDAFRREFERDSSNYSWPIEQHFNHELLGRGMFYNKTRGSCTSTVVYLTTALRALGIPTRVILVTPAVDASDRQQVLMVKNTITHNRVRLTMLAGLSWSSHGFTNHTLNEVYVGNRWCRLDSGQLGCPAFGQYRFGLQTHLYTFNDLSDVNLAPTWGWRYAKGERNDTFPHDNPYSAVEVSESFGAHGNISNPRITAQDICPHGEPDIFLFYPSRAEVWQEFTKLVASGTANKTGRPHQKEFYDNAFDGIWLIRPQDILVLLFSLDTPERIPAGYEDLLPEPWPQIESRLKRGETVELSARARDMNIILLAAPTSAELKPLVRDSRLLNALPKTGGLSTGGSPQAGSPEADRAPAAKLANGVTVRFLAYSQLTSEGLKWWTSASEATSIPGVYEADVDGLGTVLAFDVYPPDSTVYAQIYRGSEKDLVKNSWRLPNSNTWLFPLGEQRNFANVEITTRIVEPPVVGLIPLTREDQDKVVEVGKFGIDTIVDLEVLSTGTSTAKEGAETMEFPQYGGPVGLRASLPVIQFTVLPSPGSYPSIVALRDREGLTHPVVKNSGNARATTYEAYISPDRLADIVVEASPVRESNARFRNISLTPGHATTVQVETDPQPQMIWTLSRVGLMLGVLVNGLEQYQNDRGGRLPASLQGMRAYLHDDNFSWLTEHVAYIGRGGLPTNEPNVPIAYDKTLLPQGKGAYVIYDDRRIQFEGPKRLEKLGIATDGEHRTEATPDARQKMQQLGLAIAMYANEHSGDLPTTLAPLEPYLSDPQALAWLNENVIYMGKGNVNVRRAGSVVTAYEKTPQPTSERYVLFLDYHVERVGSERLKALGVAATEPSSRAADVLKGLMDKALPGATVVVPNGTYRTAIEITRAVVLRGESQESCVMEITADQPAILVKNVGKGDVTIENMTIRWQLATDKKVELPAAVLVRDENAVIRNCRFVPLGDYKRSPVAVYIDGRSKSTVDNCRFSGFDYTICYGPGTEGIVQDCIITDCGHQGVINYDGSTLTVQRNIITGSKFHAVRCTGGTLHVKDNLLMKNANRGIYLGNKTGRGMITNNLIVGNGTGISAFGRADYAIANNVIVNNDYAGIDMRDSCRLAIRNNVLAKNQRGIALHKEGTEDFNVLAENAYWGNATDVENMDKPQGSIAADPQFADPNHGDFSVRGPAQEQSHGLTNPEIIMQLWRRYERLQSERLVELAQQANPVPPSTPVQTVSRPPTVLA